MQPHTQSLQALVKALEGFTLTREAFLKAFREVVQHQKVVEAKLVTHVDEKTKQELVKIEALRGEFEQVIEQVKSESDSNLSTLKRKTLELVDNFFAKSDVKKKLEEANIQQQAMLTEVSSLVVQLNEKLATLKNGDNGRDGIDADEERIITEVLASLNLPNKEEMIASVENNLPTLGLRIRDAMELLPEGDKLEMSAIEGLEEALKEIKAIRAPGFGGGSAGDSSINVSLQRMVQTVTPTGDIDSANKVYTTPTDINIVFSFAINGMFIHDAEYTISGNTITFTTALPSALSGTSFTIKYV